MNRFRGAKIAEKKPAIFSAFSAPLWLFFSVEVRMVPISAVIITRNESANIEDALRSVSSWVDEIVVVDSGSTDDTLEICKQYTSRILCREWSGFVDQKNFASDRASNDWIFSLDADERPSPELIEEIQSVRSGGFDRPGYRIPRIAFFMGRWLRHGDWYPDFQLRLFDRRRGRWQGGRVHESFRLQGCDPGILKGPLHHYTYRSLSDYLKRLESYTTLAAADYRDRGNRSSAAKLMLDPFATFWKAYLLKRGLLDGVPGLMAAVMGAVSVYFKYAKLYELQIRDQNWNRNGACPH
jgi:glycosyltransferase involved in cell wall biosynthesis